MDKFFVPYAGTHPAAIDIKGHRLLIVSTDEDDVEQSLSEVGGTEVREIDLKEMRQDETQVLANLAADINGGVVLAPPGIPLMTMIHSLELQLPWIH